MTYMAFERFNKAEAVAVAKPARVSVSTSGILSLTWQAFEMLGKPTFVEYFYDPERRVIAIAPAVDEANAYQVRMPRGDRGASASRGAVSLRGETFLKYYDLDFSTVWRRTPWMEGNYLCFSIDDSDEQDRVAPHSSP